MTGSEILQILAGLRLPLNDEKRLQAAIEEEFQRRGVVFEREARLSAADRPDFIVQGRIVLEVKIKGQRRSIYKQVERYAQHDDVDELLLITNVPMGMPNFINGKPVLVHNLAVAWL